jgi:hypothetical protein
MSDYANHYTNQIRWFNAPNLVDRQEYFNYIEKFENVSEDEEKATGKMAIETIEQGQESQDQENSNVSDTNDNSTPQDFSYNPRQDERARAYNQWTRISSDSCFEQNKLRVGSKPMKYFVNQYNSPQVNPFTEFTVIGNQQVYDVRNEFERAIPSRLRNLPSVYVLPFPTTPNLASQNENRIYTETSSNLRFGQNIKNLKAQNLTTEVDFNRYNPAVYAQTVQNAGQFVLPGAKMQQPVSSDGYYNYDGNNNIILGNSAVPYFGISSRNLIQNALETSGC